MCEQDGWCACPGSVPPGLNRQVHILAARACQQMAAAVLAAAVEVDADLPFCRQVTEDMMSMKVKGVRTRQADGEVREAMKAGHTALAALQTQVDRMTSAESGRRRRGSGGPGTTSASGSPEVAVDLMPLSVARAFRTA